MGSKELSTDYSGAFKELLVCGVYRILNIVNSKFYIGSAKVIYDRRIRHISALRSNTHGNQHLQRAWNKYGEESFKIEVVEVCNESVLLEREQYYLDLWRSYDPSIGYNIGLQTSGGDNYTNNPNKENRQRFSAV